MEGTSTDHVVSKVKRWNWRGLAALMLWRSGAYERTTRDARIPVPAALLAVFVISWMLVSPMTAIIDEPYGSYWVALKGLPAAWAMAAFLSLTIVAFWCMAFIAGSLIVMLFTRIYDPARFVHLCCLSMWRWILPIALLWFAATFFGIMTEVVSWFPGYAKAMGTEFPWWVQPAKYVGSAAYWILLIMVPVMWAWSLIEAGSHVTPPPLGCCMNCGYDLAGLDRERPCPECGHLPRKNFAPSP
jgi:hypothetical protein